MKFLTTLLLLFIASGTYAQNTDSYAENNERSIMNKEVIGAASRSLGTLNKLVTEQNFKNMGFESAAEVKSATIGDPLPVFMVQLDELRAYKKGADPNRLLKALDKAIIPVAVNGQVRSSITVEKSKGEWKGMSFGAPNLTRALAKVQMESAAASHVPTDAYFVVHIAALNAYYLGHRANNKLMLTTIIDDPSLKQPAGKTMPAEEVFSLLSPIARQYNGLPL